MENADNYNGEVKDWGKTTLKDINRAADDENIIHRANSPSKNSSIKAIKVKYGMVGGEVKRISFGIRRHLVFVHKGLGKDTPVSKAGSTSRKEKPFLNDPLDANMEELADIVAQHTGNMLSNNIFIQ